MHNTRHQAFTLVELLVVISIIAVLIGILIPVLASARKAGKAAVCMSNMRQLAIATTGYTLDHNKYLPQPHQEGDLGGSKAQGEHLWFNAVDYYIAQSVKNYTTNPDDRNYVNYKQDPVWNELPDDAPGSEPDRRNQQTIKMNTFFGNSDISTPSGGPGVAFFKLTDVPGPSNTVLFLDGRAFDTPSTTTGNIDGNNFNANVSFVGLRHDDGANLTNVDGSVEHQVNPITQTSSGYRAWNDMYKDETFTEADRSLWPETIFNFRPEEFDRERRYLPKN